MGDRTRTGPAQSNGKPVRSPADENLADGQVSGPEQDLRRTEDLLQAKIDELGSVSESLQAANLELAQSIHDLENRLESAHAALRESEANLRIISERSRGSGLDRADQQQRAMRDEAQHRVRNILAMIRSVVKRSAETSRSVEDYARHLEGRIGAMARTQALLIRNPGVGVDLAGLIMDEFVAQCPAEDRLRLSGPDVALAPKAAEVLTLALHELATNAIKYGALSIGDGYVDVAWQVDSNADQPWLRLTWVENGGPKSPQPARAGFGTELIAQRIPFELKGAAGIEFGEKVKATIAFPLITDSNVLRIGAPRK